MKPVDVMVENNIAYCVDHTKENPKFKTRNHVRISKSKNIFAKDSASNWPVMKKVENAISWTYVMWRFGVVIVTTAQLHSTKAELRFCAGSNPACSVLEIRDGEDL